MPTFEWYFKFLLKYMAFKVIIIVIELMFLSINMFLVLLRAHFKSGQKHIYARERQLYCYISLFRGDTA